MNPEVGANSLVKPREPSSARPARLDRRRPLPTCRPHHTASVGSLASLIASGRPVPLKWCLRRPSGAPAARTRPARVGIHTSATVQLTYLAHQTVTHARTKWTDIRGGTVNIYRAEEELFTAGRRTHCSPFGPPRYRPAAGGTLRPSGDVAAASLLFRRPNHFVSAPSSPAGRPVKPLEAVDVGAGGAEVTEAAVEVAVWMPMFS